MSWLVEKLKALLQWFVLLERKKHNHWCEIVPGSTCEHRYSAWECKGIFCANVDRKDCKNCVKKRRERFYA